MIRNRLPAARLLLAVGLAALVHACGGAQGEVQAGGPGSAQVGPLVLSPVGPAPRPFGLLTRQSVAWRSSSAGTYQVFLRPDGTQLDQRLLASGNVTANQVISVEISGYELTPELANVVAFSVRDANGQFESSSTALELLPIDVLPLGSGLHDDLVYDATRAELLVTNRLGGIVQLLDMDTSSPAYGQQVALLPPGPDAGPWYVTTTLDGERGFNLYRTTMLEYDLQTLQIDNNLYLPGGFAPSGLAPTPDSSRIYIGYYHTLLSYLIAPVSAPAAIEGTGIEDGLVLGGDVAITQDGRYAFYAWFGESTDGLWVVDVDPESDDYHELLSESFLPLTPVPEVGVPVTPRVSIAPSGQAAYVGSTSGISKFAVEAPEFELLKANPSVPLTGLATTSVEGTEYVLAWEPFGSLTILSDELEIQGLVQLPELLVSQAAVDEAGGRLFLIAQQQQTSGRLLVVPLR